MRVVVSFALCMLVAVIFSSSQTGCASDPKEEAVDTDLRVTWSTLDPLPGPLGVAGPYVGLSNDALIVAGGANFPDGPPWEGHAKVWYDTAYVKPSPEAPWQTIEHALPAPRGYGVSISTPAGLICIAGNDAKQHGADVFLLKWSEGKLNRVEMPPLPIALANLSGAMVDHVVYVAGGIEKADATTASHRIFTLDLSATAPQWKEIEPWPGPERMLATAAAQDGSFFLIGGVSLHAGPDGKPVRDYLKDAYRYTPGQGWKRIADLPLALAASPSPTLSIGESQLILFGGDDGLNVNFKPMDKHPGFSKRQMLYDTKLDTWTDIGELPVGHVTTTVVRWKGKIIIPTGEIRPGVRTPEILAGELLNTGE